MDRSTFALVGSIVAMGVAFGFLAYQVLVKQRNPELAYLAWAALLAGAALVIFPIINPAAPADPFLREMGGPVVGTLLILGAVRLVNHLRQRHRPPTGSDLDDPPAVSSADETPPTT